MGHESIVAKIGLVCSVAFLILGSFTVAGASVTLSWNPSTSTNVAGYEVFYGVADGQYTNALDAGTNTTITVSGLADGQTYFFAATTYDSSGDQSLFSNQVTNDTPILPTPPPVTVIFDPFAAPTSTNPPTILYSSSERMSRKQASGTNSTVGDDDTPDPPAPVAAPAAPARGYNGLFYQTDAAGVPATTEATTAFLGHCVIKTTGHYTARLACAGRIYSIAGKFNANGDDTAVVSRREARLPNLNVVLHVESALGKGRMTGFLSNMDPADPWVAPLTACLATNAYAPAAKFRFLSPSPPDQSGRAPANCCCELIVDSKGVVSLLGRLGDGEPISQTVAIADDGTFPVYVSLYHRMGLLAGWMNLDGGAPNGSLTWIRPAFPSQAPPDQHSSSYVLQFFRAPGSTATSLQLSQ